MGPTLNFEFIDLELSLIDLALICEFLLPAGKTRVSDLTHPAFPGTGGFSFHLLPSLQL
jgi:hypothetical protein